MQRPSIFYNGCDSADDHGLVVTSIKHPTPKKKIVRADVAYSSKSHDFSMITGKYAYEQRELEYTFAVRATSPEALEAVISRVQNWLLEAPAGDLQESISPDWHFSEVTCDSCEPEYISERYASLTAAFTAYPYKVFNYTRPQYYSFSSVLAEQQYELTAVRDIIPCFTTVEGCRVKVGNVFYDIPAGSVRYQFSDIVFSRGYNSFSVMALSNISGDLRVECIEERL